MQTAETTLRVADAIRLRRSVRAFKPDLVPRETIWEILDLARNAPSWSNTQPWDVAVVAGAPLAAIKAGFCGKVAAGVGMAPEVPRPTFPERFEQRRREIGSKIFEALGVGRDDAERRLARDLAMQRFLDAPVGLIFYMDAELGPWSMLDLGIFMQNIMLGAMERGLGTCPMAAAVNYPDVLREVLAIPASKRIYVGMALGYPDRDAVANRIRSERRGLDEVVTWYGVE